MFWTRCYLAKTVNPKFWTYCEVAMRAKQTFCIYSKIAITVIFIIQTSDGVTQGIKSFDSRFYYH